ncbi:enolase C-terminal domain-like protein [Paenibacillus sacheonensis]|uniref:Starvation-sensing protein RspA n=1 Tax=Paenibacillus sacheonensis TaxID=742054 RepID=A0A7X4YL37_9BACL|nr:enolase C-terminal domain-like protein [Paenibacillus sacheonensis]MBM7568790.1 mannonate dehydratase [Paenibacillus sacheonensis]NBC68377.1 starvation-sensing protein RspA [Paenibacillus sacheonensis]
MSKLTIRDVKVILTAPEGINLVVVKIETSEPGLYGLGCATFTQRYLAVATAIEQYLKPFLIGKDPHRIEDIWQSAMVSSYWRNGPVLNNALSGIDMALWDIKGKSAGLPVFQLLGGKCREAAAIYRHADGRDEQEVEDNVRRLMEQGLRYIRCQMGGYGGRNHTLHQPEHALPGAYFDPNAYMRSVPRMFEHVRGAVGVEVELLHDIHERLVPIEAVRLAKQLEPYRLFFLEDPLAPEQLDWFETMRSQTAIPIAMGELFTHPREWTPLIAGRLIDFIRCHISAIGGLTPAKKLATLCEAFSVRTAWHGPGDVSPVGHAANLHLDVSSINFGIQEWYGFSDQIQEVFPGCPVVKYGYAYPNDKPGLGIDIDEEKAAAYPCSNRLPEWTLARTPDGTSVRP